MSTLNVRQDANLILVCAQTPLQGRDLLLRVSEALSLSQSLLEVAFEAEQSTESKAFKGEGWGARVESYDGYVALRFRFPPVTLRRTVIPLSVSAARSLAEQITFKAQQAEHRARLVFHARGD